MMLVNWYRAIYVRIKWGSEISEPIAVRKSKCTLDPHPEWTLNGVKLDESTGISYLGVTLSHSKPNEHVEKRISACRRAYYALQGAGFGNDVTNVDALAYVWNSAIRGINCINVSKTCLAKMEKLQTRLLKTGVGLHKYLS